MLLREAAALRIGGGRDEDGQVIPPTETAIRAEFAALTAEESAAAARTPSSVSYRMTFRWPDVLPAATAVSWRGKLYQFVGPSMMVAAGGRLHHQEAIITRATG